MKKILYSLLATAFLTSCNRIGLGVGVVVSGDTVADGASWLGDNIGTIIIVILIIIAIIAAIVFIASVAETAENKDKAKQILKKEEEKKLVLQEKMNAAEESKQIAEKSIQNDLKSIEYETVKIRNLKDKIADFIDKYRKEGRPKGISISMYSSLYCDKSLDFYSWLFDDPSLQHKQESDLDRTHKIIFNAFKMIAEKNYKS